MQAAGRIAASVAQPGRPASGWLPRWRERWCAWRDRLLTEPATSSAAPRAPGTCGRSRGGARARCSTWWPASSIRRCCWPACACAPSRSLPKGRRPLDALARALRAAAAGRRAAAGRGGRRWTWWSTAAAAATAWASWARRWSATRPSPPWSSTTRVLYADLRDPLALLRGAGRGAGAVALLGLCRGRGAGRAAARRGRRATRR